MEREEMLTAMLAGHSIPLGTVSYRNQVLLMPLRQRLLLVCTICTARLCWSFWEHPQYKLFWWFHSKGEYAAKRPYSSVFCL